MKKIKIPLRIAAVLLMAALALQMSSCSLFLLGMITDSNSTEAPADNETQIEALPTEQVTTSKGTNDNKAFIGDTVKVGNWEFTVLSATDSKTIGSGYFTKTTNNNYVTVIIKVKNTGNKEDTLHDDMVKLYIGEAEYQISNDSTYVDNDNKDFWLLDSVGAGLTNRYNMVFETPSAHTDDCYISFKSSSFSFESKKVYLTYRNKMQ